jgi:hypothetical protein
MPFNATFNDVWKGAIEKAAKELGMRPIRVDMINRSSNITDDIVESIKKCHLAIVDVSDNNAPYASSSIHLSNSQRSAARRLHIRAAGARIPFSFSPLTRG